MFFSLSHLTYSILEGKLPPFKMDTAYVLIGNSCRNNCLFCSFSLQHHDKSKKWLSRVSWREIEVNAFLEKIHFSNFRRICFQLACSKAAIDFSKRLLQRNSFQQKLSLSCWLDDLATIEEFFSLGIEKLALNLDVVGKNHSAIKGGNGAAKLKHILEAAAKYPYSITTHLIVGCGETDRELTEIIDRLVKNKVTVSLFPYTPFKGLPPSQYLTRPDLKRYRLLQLYLFLKTLGLEEEVDWCWEENRLVRVEFRFSKQLENLLQFENLFMTQGCQFCTRPFYNDSPRQKEFYNYHYPLSYQKKKEILKTLTQK